MASINPYLNFNGKTEEAFNFYKSVFGGDFKMVQRMKDTPESGNVPANERDRIMHVALPIGKENMLMGSDIMESMGHKLALGNNMHIAVSAGSLKEAEKIFNGLSAAGTVTMPLEKAFWGAYFGMTIDKFGVQWMMNFDENQPR